MLKLSVLAVIIVLTPTLSFAGGHGHSPSLSDLFWPWVNFLIYLGIMYSVLKKPLRGVLLSRSERMSAAIERSRTVLEQARAQFDMVQTRLDNLDRESHQIKAQIKDEGEREAKRIIDDAKKKAERTLEQARKLGAAETRAMENALRRELAEVVVKRASDRISKELTSDKDRSLRSSSVNNLKQMVA